MNKLWWEAIYIVVYRAMVESLQAENVELKKNLGLATSRQNEIRDNLIAEKFEALLSSQGEN